MIPLIQLINTLDQLYLLSERDVRTGLEITLPLLAEMGNLFNNHLRQPTMCQDAEASDPDRVPAFKEDDSVT